MPDPAVIDAILADIADGASMRQATAAAGVNRRVFFAVLDADQDIANRYARAITAGCESIADDILFIADDQDIPPESRRVMIDPRKWLLSKRMPKVYGDKIQTEHSGSVSVSTVDYSKADDAS